MRVPLSWLADFVPHGVDARDHDAVRRLADTLDSLGLVVEGIEHVGGGLEGVVLARVVEIRPIEGADRIRQALVDAGHGDEPLEIVCGAWNFAVGDVVALATVGTELPGGMVIAKRKMKGAVSAGMLCSAEELGLAGDGEGILVLASTGAPGAELPPGLELGSPLADHLGIEADAVLDIAVEPNRPDCLSITGIARDLAARLGLPFHLPEPRVAESGPPAGELASVRTASPGLCPSLAARVLTGVVVLPSSARVARRLSLAGMRPVSSVVDASNYVMLELGRPTHPYDLDRLGGSGILARAARPGEQLTTLDGVRRVLGRALDARGVTVEVEDCLICDAQDHPVGLAGLMGGADSEITDSTTRVLVEVARFDPVAISRTSKRQGLRSEASLRFERGVDAGATRLAADRFAELVVEAALEAGVEAPVVAPALLCDEALPAQPVHVALRLERLNALLGTSLPAAQVEGLLGPIGFRTGRTGPEVLDVEVPTFRPDVRREVDVVEEVARHYGYERIEARVRPSPRVGRLTAAQHGQRKLRRLLTGLGAHEVWTSPMVDPVAHGHGAGSLLRLANPMTREESALRGHLLPGLLGALAYNASHRNDELRLFEIGHVFAAAPSGSVAGAGDAARPGDLPVEREHLGVLLAGHGDDAATAMSCWRRIADGLAIEPSAVSILQPLDAQVPVAAGAHPTRTALVVAGRPVAMGARDRRRARPPRRGDVVGAPARTVIGAVGEVHPDELAAFGLGGRRAGWIVLDVGHLLGLARVDRQGAPVSRYPSSDLDLAFAMDETVAAGELERVLVEAAGPWCESVRLVDVYRGPSVASGARGLAYRLRYCAPDHTLDEAELASLRRACITAVEQRLPAHLRS